MGILGVETKIETRYKQALKTDLLGLAKNKTRKFAFTLKSLGLEYLHGKLYDLALDDLEANDSIEHKTVFGSEMWDNLVLRYKYADREKPTEITIDMVLMDVSMTKNIIKTSIQGMNGTVKEYISDGDYIINIKGALFGESNEYPEDTVLDLLDMLKQHESIEVDSIFLSHFNIDEIVVENYKLEAKEGQKNVQFFEINAVSDKPQELTFSEENQNKPLVPF